jgi:uncharacterized protein YdhG (YjbR/CyaY superfamily)
MKATAVTNVNEYIADFPAATRQMLKQLRSAIKETAPEAEEYIGYQMPAYKLHGILVYFAGYKNHIGFYPGTAALEKFSREVEGFKTSKGTVQFPLDQPLPLKLIRDMVKFRVKENMQKQKKKAG